MTAFALALATTYVVLGVLFTVAVQLSGSAFGRLSLWGFIIVLVWILALSRWVPPVCDALLRPFLRSVVKSRDGDTLRP